MRNNTWALQLRMSLAVLMLALTPTLLYSAATPGNSFVQHNLVSDIPGLASYTDPALVNPWGVSFGATSPFWVSDADSGVSTIYNSFGKKQALTVSIPGPLGSMGPGEPTGQVNNPNTANFQGSIFIFAGEDGVISGWSGGTSALVKADNSAASAIYKGLAMASNSSGTFLYATDFHNGKIDVFDTNFGQTSLSGSFTDPNLPAGYAPFNISASGNRLYVTYALQDALKEDDVACPGCGFLDVFDTDGNLVQRLVSAGALNAPWGLAWAPTGFGKFGGDLLVGNFGDGTINAYDPATGNWMAVLMDQNGNPISNEGLWALTFGNGGNGGSTNILYFTAGIEDETHGLFGSVSAVPEPGTLTLLGSGFVSLLGYGLRRGKRMS